MHHLNNLNFDKFKNASEGWYFNGETKQVTVRYANQNIDVYKVQINFDIKDLISL